MCGIAGHWDVTDVDLGAMLATLRHRGPDDAGTVELGEDRALGHRRLSIVDLEGGAQPFVRVHGDGRRCLVANGEIYNAERLREELATACASRSDNEVVLHLLDDGPQATARLDGMFAFARSDGDELVLGRDPLGIKPLYVGDLDGGLVFASELKALPPGTGRVRAVAPGTTSSTTSGDAPYWTMPDPTPAGWDLDESARRVRHALHDAVEARLMADVPVGAFLSGGLDSSAICALLAPMVDELHTFSVGLEASPDLRAARRVAAHLGTTHHERVLTPAEIAEAPPGVVVALESFDQDLVRSAVPTWFVAELAARHVKVVLTGEGADELFAGYRYHRGFDDALALQRETRRSLAELHHVNLQRVDRMTMAHSLEARVPFLDTRVVETALRVPPGLRLPSVGGIEKTVLRRAVEDLLPPEIVRRDKAQFDEGSGSSELLASLPALAEGIDVDAYRRRYPATPLRSAEECAYHRMLVDGVAAPEVVLPNVARWSERP